MVKNKLLLSVFIALFIVVLGYSIAVGTAKINIFSYFAAKLGTYSYDDFESIDYIMMQIRLPRIILCSLVGMALGLSGNIMQTLLKNPLASPFTLGVSSGAAFGAALVMVLGHALFSANLLFAGYTLVALHAFLGGLLSLVIVTTISRFNHHSTTVLVLCGTAISSLFSAGVALLKYFSNAEALKDLSIWLMGGFWGANWKSVLIVLSLLIVSFIFFYLHSWRYNALIAGDEIAISLGINIKKLRRFSLLFVTLIASTAIAFSGIIGFIGLVAPHISRNLLGMDHRYTLPGSLFLGSIILLCADTLARTIISPIELPVGIITSLIGVPFFILILTRGNRKMWM